MSTRTLKITIENENGEEEEISLPGKYEVCSSCLGEGTHVNPNIDGHGITAEEWEQDWDDESRDMYFSGGYDVTCYQCQGQRVTLDIDEDWINTSGTDQQKEALVRYHDNLLFEADCRRQEALERAMGC